MAHPPPPSIAPQEDEPRALSAAEFWRLIAPWLGHAFLAAAALLGLFTASGASDGATYAVGLATFALAILLIAVRMRLQLDGRDPSFLLAVSVESGDALAITIALLAILGLTGAVLAATIGGTVYTIGMALFVVCAALIFFELKRYFDRQDGAH